MNWHATGERIYKGEPITHIGSRELTMAANLAAASKRTRVGTIVELPCGTRWARVDARRDHVGTLHGCAWVRVRA